MAVDVRVDGRNLLAEQHLDARVRGARGLCEAAGPQRQEPRAARDGGR
jgi:hypothetical protein